MSNNRIYNENVTDLSSLNKALENNARAGQEEPVVEAAPEVVETPVEDPVVEVAEEVTEEVIGEATEEVVEEVVEESVEDPVAEVTEEVVEEDIYSEWSNDSVEESTSEDPTEGLGEEMSSIASELNLEASSKDELIEKLKTKLNDGKSNDEVYNEVLEGLPKDLVDAVKLAKDGGDYKTLMEVSNADYNQVSDEALYGNMIEQYFTDAEGNFNETGLQEHLDSLSENELRIKAGEIRSSLIAQQEIAKQNVLREQTEKKTRAQAGIKKALESFEDVNGFKARPDDKKAIYDSVVNDTLIKDLFFGDDGSVDYSKVSEAMFKINNFDKITNFLVTKSKNDGKRAIVQKMTNPEVKVPGKPVAAKDGNSLKSQQEKWLKSLGKQ